MQLVKVNIEFVGNMFFYAQMILGYSFATAVLSLFNHKKHRNILTEDSFSYLDKAHLLLGHLILDQFL